MTYLLDTQIFLWLILTPEKISNRAAQILSATRADLKLSMASIWEIAIKKGLGKLTFPEPLEETLRYQLAVNRIELLPIEFLHALQVRALPLHHKDPFDRLIIAQALSEHLPIVSSDANFDRYGIERIW